MEVEAWLTRAASRRPDHAALETAQGEWSFARLYAAARFGAGALLARGAGPGRRVAIALPAGLDFAQALHACLLLGAIAVPVDLRLSASEQEPLIAGASVLVSEPLGEGPDPPGLTGAPRHELDATAVVIHTSGTTAAPRPVELTYGNLLWSALGSAVALGTREDERWLCALTLAHVGGLSVLVRCAIGATTAIVHERFEVDRVLHDLTMRRVSGVSLVATTLARLLDAGLQSPPQLRFALTGGGPVPAALVQRARDSGVPVGLTYGLSQAASQVTTTPLGEIARGPFKGLNGRVPAGEQNAGRPLFCTRVGIAPDGEILVRGPTVAPATIEHDGWMHTGDLGALDDRGRLLVTGRKLDTIVSGGENVAPAEVEAVLEAHPQVLEAAVLARTDARWGEAVVAIVVAHAGAEPEPEALRAHCAAQLAPFKVPKDFTFTAEPLPRTAWGKLLRRELR
jgi:O-succinylbenzoic acid--CoA ligase